MFYKHSKSFIYLKKTRKKTLRRNGRTLFHGKLLNAIMDVGHGYRAARVLVAVFLPILTVFFWCWCRVQVEANLLTSPVVGGRHWK